MSIQRVIKLGQALEYKYAQQQPLLSAQEARQFQTSITKFVKANPGFAQKLNGTLQGGPWSASDIDGKPGNRTAAAWAAAAVQFGLTDKDQLLAAVDKAAQAIPTHGQSVDMEATKRAIDAANKILQQTNIKFGRQEASDIVQYLQAKNLGVKPTLGLGVSHYDRIIANMVYNKIPDKNIVYTIQLLLYALKDLNIDFSNERIQPAIDRYKIILSKYGNDGRLADQWSMSGQRVADFTPPTPTQPARKV